MAEAFFPPHHLETDRRWHPLVAALLSVVVPGLGQIYKGQFIGGIFWLIAVLSLYVTLIVPGAVLHVLCVIAAATGDPFELPPAYLSKHPWDPSGAA